MSNGAESRLESFLASLPLYQRKYLEHGLSSLSREETDQFNDWFRKSEEYLSASNPTEELLVGSFPVVAEAYRLLLSQAPTKLKERRERMRQEGFSPSVINFALPKLKPGRKRNDALAERIWQLGAQGKSNREIQKIVNASGNNLSLEGVESYKKTRRRPHHS